MKEYYALAVTMRDDVLTDALNEFTEKGWDLVQILTDRDGFFVIVLVREKEK